MIRNSEVFYDGTEKLITRTDDKNPDAPERKYKVEDFSGIDVEWINVYVEGVRVTDC